MRRKILSLIIATGLAMSISMPTLAVTLTQQLNNQKEQLLNQQSTYAELQKNYDKLEMSIEMLDSDIGEIYTEIDKAKYEINDTEKNIEQNTKDITISENNIKDEEELFNQRMRVMYINGTDNYLEILLSADGIDDLISRVENVKKIVEYDNKVISDLNEKKKIIEIKKNVLNDNKTRLLTLKAVNENKLDKLNTKQNEQHTLIAEAKKQEELHKNEITQTQALLGSTMNEIEEESIKAANYDLAIVAKKAQQTSISRGSTGDFVQNEAKSEISVEPKVEPPVVIKKEVSEPKATSSVSSNAAVIAYAKTFLGTPYEWAATGPNSFDCSGFVQYVYKHFGVTTGRNTSAQIANGQYVSRANLQPGDLVFFGSGTPHHVGIYVGNNSYIHAPHTGDVVKISILTRSDYLSARRVR
ncbi:C40 family peptidase [Clostridium sp.]|uniref:C40 family peptidase n=1 Tax=Clostridium sp. TaxID=1506 RepID=UPI001A3B0D64|nr:C40 family peptidase [Clostridium sp.]MBK5240101.1 C40 family peptidase [Clostridium sp.]